MKLLALLVLLFSALAASACPVCRPQVAAGIYSPAYAANAGLVLLPVAVVLALGLGVFYWDKLSIHLPHRHASSRP